MEFWYDAQLVLYVDKLSWHDAEAHCVSKNGHLASVASLQDKKEVDDLISQFVSNDSLQSGEYVWLGGSDASKDGRWTWTSHTPWKVEYWKTSEPTEGYDYLATGNGKWESWGY